MRTPDLYTLLGPTPDRGGLSPRMCCLSVPLTVPDANILLGVLMLEQ